MVTGTMAAPATLKLSDVAKLVVERKSFVLVRDKKDTPGCVQMVTDNEDMFAEIQAYYDSEDCRFKADAYGRKPRGYMVFDMFTASAVNTVYNALNAENKAKLDSMPIMKAVGVCWKCLK